VGGRCSPLATSWRRGGCLFAPEKARGYYPPALTGLRGSTPGSFEAAHDLKDGFFQLTAPRDTGEEYDLVVVGAGISGLSAAHFFRKRAPKARVLLLDNHDDFGGHARRNEFRDGKRLYVTYGGTLAIDSPASYSAVAKGLIAELGIDVRRWDEVLDRKAYAGLDAATFFDREAFGADRLVKGLQREQDGPDPRALAETPLAAAVQRDILRLETEAFDPWPRLSSDDKKARLLRMSYEDYLTKVWALDAGVLPYYRSRGYGLFGVGPDAISALDGWGLGFPGFRGLTLAPGYVQGMNRDAMREPEAEEYFFHYPDGNASVARLLVRALVPAPCAGRAATPSSWTAPTTRRSTAADRSACASTARWCRRGTQAAGVDVVYVRGGALHKVRGKTCIMACWSAVIPHLCREMPEPQREALAFAVKVPLVYTSVFVRNWQAWKTLGVRSVSCPGSYWHSMRLDVPVNVGGFACAKDPAEPIVVNLSRVPCEPAVPRATSTGPAGQELLDTPFAHMERKIREQMARVLGPGGFDPRRTSRPSR
jgi:spermidine dehydrogenase